MAIFGYNIHSARWILKYIISWVAILSIALLLLPLSVNFISSVESPSKDKSESIKSINVLLSENGEIKTMDINEYIVGVVAAEMPATFEVEALMAQAVAARTYTVSKLNENVHSKVHKGADICTDPTHCQAYISPKDACAAWKENASDYLKKCKKAVYDTANVIMVYKDEPVKAVFHSSSSGITENAADVWGGDVPYLVSVESPGEEKCPSHKSKVTVSIDEFKKTVSKKYAVDFSKKIIGTSVKTSGGMVKELEVGNVKIKGTEIRSMFSLRSASFDAVEDGKNIVFDVVGNGHGVGMSQYGANYLASVGYDYKQILKKYYTGIEFSALNE